MRALALLTLIALAAPATAQPSDLLRAVREATARLDYPAAEARAREALAQPEGLAPDDLVEVHAALGVVLHARGAASEAREQFRAALSLDPALRLDSVLVSPLTLALLEEVRDEAAAAPPGATPAAVRYVVLPDRRPGAALRSAVLPGWGQWHKGDRARGVAFAVGVGAAAVGTGAAHLAYRSARERYGAAATPVAIADAYADTRRLHRLRSGLAVAAALGWAAAVAEALVTGAPRAPSSVSARRVAADVAPGGLALRVRL